MRSSPLVCLLVLAGGLVSGCGGGDTLGADGSSGGGPSGTAGRSPDDGGEGGGAGADCVSGVLDCPCYGNDTCDAPFQCEDGVCVACDAGALGCPCYGNGTCNEGLTCESDLCEPDGAGGEGGALAGAGGTPTGGAIAGGSEAVGGSPTTGGVATGGVEVGGVATGGNGVTPLGGQSGGGSGAGGEAGAATTPCGDGVVQPPEQCDDGNGTEGDGCDARCRWEPEFVCTGTAPNYNCRLTICGDGVVEGHESCDDGNSVAGDGCSPTCGLEPICDGGACVSSCGDGLLSNAEQCDDGNDDDGDGCSATCQVESGYECHPAPPATTMELSAVYRDFKATHPDFELGATGCEDVSPNMVAAALDGEGKPTLDSANISTSECNYVSSATTFAEWYRDVPGVNATIATTLTLYANGRGGYANRYGDEGEPFTATVDTGNEQPGYGTSQATCETTCTQRTRDALGCENVCRADHDQVDLALLDLEEAMAAPEPDAALIIELEAQLEELEAAAAQCDADCAAEFASREAACQAACLPCSYNDQQWCIGGEEVEYDGTPTFFPVDDSTFDTARSTATIPPAYGGVWEEEPSGIGHNFHFTSEIHFWFTYDAAGDQVLEFTGDDDVWVFVNGTLAVDLGGIHMPVDGSVNLRDAAASLGLTDGSVYEIVVFQAERQTSGSSFRLVLSGFAAPPSECSRI